MISIDSKKNSIMLGGKKKILTKKVTIYTKLNTLINFSIFLSQGKRVFKIRINERR